jgi:protein AATF/BFR2
MAPRNNRAKVFAELDEQPVRDYDPEGEISQDEGGSDSDSQESVDENAGTEHYVSVGCVPLVCCPIQETIREVRVAR